jgi:hypothetical protein
VVPARAHSRQLFHFVHKHRQEIQLLIPIAQRLRRQDSLVPAFSNQLENLTGQFVQIENLIYNLQNN